MLVRLLHYPKHVPSTTLQKVGKRAGRMLPTNPKVPGGFFTKVTLVTVDLIGASSKHNLGTCS